MSGQLSSSENEEEEQPSVGLINSRRMEARAEHLKTRNYLSIYTFTTGVGVGMVTMLLVWLKKYRGGFSWTNPNIQFNWHPLLMGIGMIFLYGQAILIYRTARNRTKRILKMSHALCNFLAFILCVIGLKAAFDSHNHKDPPVPNLYTMHSWMGLVTAIIFAGQFLVGFITFLLPGLARSVRQFMLPVHTATGVATFGLAVAACVTGLTEKTIWTLGPSYSNLPSEAILVNFICIFAVFYGILCMYLVNEADYKRTTTPEDEIALSEN